MCSSFIHLMLQTDRHSLSSSLALFPYPNTNFHPHVWMFKRTDHQVECFKNAAWQNNVIIMVLLMQQISIYILEISKAGTTNTNKKRLWTFQELISVMKFIISAKTHLLGFKCRSPAAASPCPHFHFNQKSEIVWFDRKFYQCSGINQHHLLIITTFSNFILYACLDYVTPESILAS